MKPRDAFGVIVRAAGFGFLLAALIDLAHVAAQLLGLPIRTTTPPELVLTSAGLWFVLGVAVLVGASRIVSLIYGKDNAS